MNLLRGISITSTHLRYLGRILFGVALFIFPDISYAQGATDIMIDNQIKRVQGMNDIIGIASRAWVIPAKLAGFLMTNYFIYGETFYLVDYLFKFWQITRTFSLFALGLFFSGYLLYTWFNNKEAKSKIADLIKNTVIAGILISMSWWLVAATVDISVIFTSAVAGIPSQIYEQEREKKQGCFSVPKRINVGTDLQSEKDLLGNPTNYKAPDRDILKPHGDNVSGPLMFFGAAVLKFFEAVYIPEQEFQGESGDNAQVINSKVLILVAIKAFLILMLIIPLVILMIVNIIRIVYLRVWIIFAPFIVLVNIFDWKISDSLKKHISWKNIMGLIMQPVAVVGMLSISLIFIIELSSVFNLCVADPENNSLLATPLQAGVIAPIGDAGSNIGTETTLGASLSAAGEFVGGITGQMIMAIFVIIMMRALIKVGFSFSELTKNVSSSITDGVEKFAGTIPVVPLPGVGSIGVGAAQNFAKGGFGLQQAFRAKQARQQDNVMEKYFGDAKQISKSKIEELSTFAKRSNAPLHELQAKIHKELEEKTISAQEAKDITQTWLKRAGNNSDNQNALQKIGLSSLAKDWSDEELQKLRSDPIYKPQAYKLLNWLFTKSTSTMANDATTTINTYGNFKQ